MQLCGAELNSQTKMARVVVSLRIMPESPETDLTAVEAEAKTKIIDFAGKVPMLLLAVLVQIKPVVR